jgi:hypothetical protein
MPTPEQIRQRKIYERDHQKKIARKVAAGMTEREAEEQLAEGDLQVLKGHMAEELSDAVL